MFNNIILSVMAWTTNTVGGFVTKLKEERGQDIWSTRYWRARSRSSQESCSSALVQRASTS